ncbi:MAG TPA: hypothetical protein VHE61_08170 [Opitutaceae bacterium]|nr:hypothetical protein [Opitutaceae bacterium]
MATIHPSAILRMHADDRDTAIDAFVADLKAAAAMLPATSPACSGSTRVAAAGSRGLEALGPAWHP